MSNVRHGSTLGMGVTLVRMGRLGVKKSLKQRLEEQRAKRIEKLALRKKRKTNRAAFSRKSWLEQKRAMRIIAMPEEWLAAWQRHGFK
jgi:hypothetical protein